MSDHSCLTERSRKVKFKHLLIKYEFALIPFRDASSGGTDSLYGLRGHERSNLFKFAVISEIVRDRVQRSKLFTLAGLLNSK